MMREEDLLLRMTGVSVLPNGSQVELWDVLEQGQPVASSQPYQKAKKLACDRAESRRLAVYRQRGTEQPQFVGSFR